MCSNLVQSTAVETAKAYDSHEFHITHGLVDVYRRPDIAGTYKQLTSAFPEFDACNGVPTNGRVPISLCLSATAAIMLSTCTVHFTSGTELEAVLLLPHNTLICSDVP